MIIYDTRQYFGYGMFLYLRNSSLPEQLPNALLAAGLALLLTHYNQYIHGEDTFQCVNNITLEKAPYVKGEHCNGTISADYVPGALPKRGAVMPETVVGHPASSAWVCTAVLSFLLVFRTNMAYQRWWEGRSAVQIYMSRLGCAGLQLMSWTNDPLIRNEALRLLLLINAIVFENLRGDGNENDPYGSKNAADAGHSGRARVGSGFFKRRHSATLDQDVEMTRWEAEANAAKDIYESRESSLSDISTQSAPAAMGASMGVGHLIASASSTAAANTARFVPNPTAEPVEPASVDAVPSATPSYMLEAAAQAQAMVSPRLGAEQLAAHQRAQQEEKPKHKRDSSTISAKSAKGLQPSRQSLHKKVSGSSTAGEKRGSAGPEGAVPRTPPKHERKLSTKRTSFDEAAIGMAMEQEHRKGSRKDSRKGSRKRASSTGGLGMGFLRKNSDVDAQRRRHFTIDSSSLVFDDDTRVIRISASELKALNETNVMDREFVVMGWLHAFMSRSHESGKFFPHGAMFSRAFGVLSEARVAVNQCKKIQDTPFPFAYAQLLFVMLQIFALVVPWTCSQYLGGHVLPAVVSGCAIFVYFSVNGTAAELEQPFGRWDDDSNIWRAGRLPLKQFEAEMKHKLLAGSLAIDTKDPHTREHLTQPQPHQMKRGSLMLNAAHAAQAQAQAEVQVETEKAEDAGVSTKRPVLAGPASGGEGAGVEEKFEEEEATPMRSRGPSGAAKQEFDQMLKEKRRKVLKMWGNSPRKPQTGKMKRYV